MHFFGAAGSVTTKAGYQKHRHLLPIKIRKQMRIINSEYKALPNQCKYAGSSASPIKPGVDRQNIPQFRSVIGGPPLTEVVVYIREITGQYLIKCRAFL